jgi:hypothetical protein
MRIHLNAGGPAEEGVTLQSNVTRMVQRDEECGSATRKNGMIKMPPN